MDFSLFQSGFLTVFETIMILFVISFFGWLSVKFKFINDDGIAALSRILVDVVVPAKLVIDITANLNAKTIQTTSYMTIGSLLTIFLGVGLGYLMTFLWRSKESGPSTDNSIVVMSSLHNGIFLPLPLLIALTPPESQSLATLYVGAVYFVAVIFQWTFGVTLLGSKGSLNWKDRLKPLLNMPLLAIVLGIICSRFSIFVNAAKGLESPAIVSVPFEAAQILGTALAPIAMLTLGTLIAQCKIRGNLKFRSLAIPIVIRLLISPLLMLLVLRGIGFDEKYPILSMTLLVESAMPPATVLPIIAKRFGGDWETISAVLLVSYILALFTVPIWVGFMM